VCLGILSRQGRGRFWADAVLWTSTSTSSNDQIDSVSAANFSASRSAALLLCQILYSALRTHAPAATGAGSEWLAMRSASVLSSACPMAVSTNFLITAPAIAFSTSGVLN